MSGAARSPARQRGVALITAMLIVALAVILATQIGFDSVLEQQRTTNVFTSDQSFQVGLGAEAWAASYLQKDAKSDGTAGSKAQDHLAEDWAKPMPPIPIDGGQIEGGLEDLQGRFNLNNLLLPEDQGGKKWRRAFRNLLTLLELEPKWEGVLYDWLDEDNQAEFPDGAEDNVYTSLTPPYRAANGPITSVSELLALPQFGLERYRKLKPYVTALPIKTPVNVCTASGIVLDALNPDGVQEHSLSKAGIARDRKEKCFPNKESLAPEAQDMVAEQSQYFRLTTFVTIGGMEFSLYSLLYRGFDAPEFKVRTIMRSFGAE